MGSEAAGTSGVEEGGRADAVSVVVEVVVAPLLNRGSGEEVLTKGAAAGVDGIALEGVSRVVWDMVDVGTAEGLAPPATGMLAAASAARASRSSSLVDISCE